MYKELDMVSVKKRLNEIIDVGTKGIVHQVYPGVPTFYLIEFFDDFNDVIDIVEVSEDYLENFSLTCFAKCVPQNVGRQVRDGYYRSSDSVKKNGRIDSLYFPGEYVAEMQYWYTSELKKASGYIRNARYGHSFVLDPLGGLIEYNFMVRDDSYSYAVIYDTTSRSYQEIGSPSVDEMRIEGEPGSANLLFSRFPRQNIAISFSTDGLNYTGLKIQDSWFMPFCAEGKIALPRNEHKIYLKIYASKLVHAMAGLEDRKINMDTVTLRPSK